MDGVLSWITGVVNSGINYVMGWISSFDPFSDVVSSIDLSPVLNGIGYANWFLDFNFGITILISIVVVWGVWMVAQLLLRWLKFIE